jgi:hypothetical protein
MLRNAKQVCLDIGIDSFRYHTSEDHGDVRALTKPFRQPTQPVSNPKSSRITGRSNFNIYRALAFASSNKYKQSSPCSSCLNEGWVRYARTVARDWPSSSRSSFENRRAVSYCV